MERRTLRTGASAQVRFDEGLQESSLRCTLGPGANWDVLGEFYGQATKGVRWMPWRQQTMKDVASCDKPRGAASRL